jgi:hypothetical protein
MLYRQGDILIAKVSNVPAELVEVGRVNGRIVLAEGEVTGHFHAIADDPATLFRQSDVDEMADRFLRVEREVAVTHDEHDTITLPPGDYVVRRQREYAPEAPVYVAD